MILAVAEKVIPNLTSPSKINSFLAYAFCGLVAWTEGTFFFLLFFSPRM